MKKEVFKKRITGLTYIDKNLMSHLYEDSPIANQKEMVTIDEVNNKVTITGEIEVIFKSEKDFKLFIDNHENAYRAMGFEKES